MNVILREYNRAHQSPHWGTPGSLLRSRQPQLRGGASVSSANAPTEVKHDRDSCLQYRNYMFRHGAMPGGLNHQLWAECNKLSRPKYKVLDICIGISASGERNDFNGHSFRFNICATSRPTAPSPINPMRAFDVYRRLRTISNAIIVILKFDALVIFIRFSTDGSRSNARHHTNQRLEKSRRARPLDQNVFGLGT